MNGGEQAREAVLTRLAVRCARRLAVRGEDRDLDHLVLIGTGESGGGMRPKSQEGGTRQQRDQIPPPMAQRLRGSGSREL